MTLRPVVPRPLRRAASRWLAGRASARIRRELSAIAARPSTIIAGPWLGEVGFELLYWVPFLAWFAEQFRIAPDRLLVLSRGGTHAWYQPFAARYADAFDQVTPEAFRAEHDARVQLIGEQKQTRLTEFERRLLATAASASRVIDWTLVHPSMMYELYKTFWWGHLTGEWINRHARYRRLVSADAELDRELNWLPHAYTAVKFYFNECFPATDANRAFAGELLRGLASRGPVVALSTGLNIDDHGGCRVDADGIHHLPEGIDPARNLRIQSHIVAHAAAFVGTYGGFSYLAPFHDVPSFAFYSNANGFSPRHLAMARDAFAQIGSADRLHVREATGGMSQLLDAVSAHV